MLGTRASCGRSCPLLAQFDFAASTGGDEQHSTTASVPEKHTGTHRLRSLCRWFLICVGLGFQACSSTSTSPDAGTEPLRIPVTIDTPSGQVIFSAEVADSIEERTTGLMFRETLLPDQGMLFLFPDEAPRSFWMKNTLVPLDMIFIRADKTILGIVENAEPKTLTQRSVPGASQFVLEVLGGRSSALGLEAEQQVIFMAPVPAD